MIEEARHSHPAMVIVGVVFVILFVAIAAATVVSVIADPIPDPATVAAPVFLPTSKSSTPIRPAAPRRAMGKGRCCALRGTTAVGALCHHRDSTPRRWLVGQPVR